jgi:hypothetical protein
MVQQLVEVAIREFGTYCVSVVAESIRRTVKDPAPRRLEESSLPAAPEHNGGCPVCAVHREAAEANALLAGLAARAAATGEIPPGLGGTIPLARKCLDDARANLPDVALAFPDLRSDIERCDRELAAAHKSLDGTLGAAEITSASRRTGDAWAACYDLADAAFAPPAKQEHDPLITWIDDVKAHPQMSNDEAIAKLKEVLDGDAYSRRDGNASRATGRAEPSRRGARGA